MRLISVIAAALTMLCLATAAGAQAPRVTATIPLDPGMRPQGICVNETTNTVYAANDNDTRISVIDGTTRAVSYIEIETSTKYICVNDSTNIVYATCLAQDKVVAIDRADSNRITSIPVGDKPWGVCVDKTTNRIYVANDGDGTVSVIDGTTNAVTHVIDVGTNPRSVCLDTTTHNVYVVNQMSDTVSVINVDINPSLPITDISITGSYMFGIDVSESDRTVFVGDGMHVYIIDADSNTFTSTVDIPSEPAIYFEAYGVCVREATQTVFEGNYGDNSYIPVIDNILTSPSVSWATVGLLADDPEAGKWSAPYEICINESTGTAYVTNCEDSVISVITYSAPAVTTKDGSPSITTTSATAACTIETLGNPAPNDHGVCWFQGTTGDPTIADSTSAQGDATSTGDYTGTMTGLTPGTYYRYRAYAINTEGTVYGETRTFATLILPTAITKSDSPVVTATSATITSSISNRGNPYLTEHGVCWGSSTDPTTAGNCTVQGAAASTGDFTSTLTGLTPETEYHYRAYATNSVGTAYGSDRTFTTMANTLPTVTTKDPISVNKTSATVTGFVDNPGDPAATEHGICWGPSTDPAMAGSRTTLGGAAAGGFTSTLTGLSPGTEYHYRAYATNSAGTAYGSDRTFTTTTDTLPTVTTKNPTSVSTTSATVTGSIDDPGDPAAIEHGVCWGTSTNPTTDGSCTSLGAPAAGDFTSTLIGLSPGTEYHYRAYATNSVGTTYGADLTFFTAAVDLTVTKTNNVNGSNVLEIDDGWTWTLSVRNTGSGSAVFTSGQTILTDQLPDTDIIYGAANVGPATSISGDGTLSAAITANTLTVTAGEGTVIIGGTNGGFDITFTATPVRVGTYRNPRSGGICQADPNDLITESSKTNNHAEDTVVVDDGDGVPADEEAGPDGNDPDYDGNGDGKADCDQPNVTSIHTSDGSGYITLACPDTGGTLEGVATPENPAPETAPPEIDFPLGFVEFRITGLDNGQATTLTFHLPEGDTADTYWKYGPTPDNGSDHWYEFLYDGTTGAIITGNEIVLHFVDGQRGDDDLAADGTIVDQGAPGNRQTAIPTLNQWGLILLILLTGLVSIEMIRRNPLPTKQ